MRKQLHPSLHTLRGDRIEKIDGAIRQVVPKATDETKLQDGGADCPACGSPMEMKMKRRLNGRKDQYSPIVRRWECACGMVLTTRGRKDNLTTK